MESRRNTTATTTSCQHPNKQWLVKLRVYDISAGKARTWSPFILGRKIEGVWHSGIEVFGYEYFYGGGIVKMRPETVESTFGIRPSRIHQLGITKQSRAQFEKYLMSIMPMFRREVYDLVSWNCNHFTDHASKQLVSRPIPTYILDLPREICDSLLGRMVLLFIRMTQGGSAPVSVTDPEHPSRILREHDDQVTNRKLRRYSCPASPMSQDGPPAYFATPMARSGVMFQPNRRQHRSKTTPETPSGLSKSLQESYSVSCLPRERAPMSSHHKEEVSMGVTVDKTPVLFSLKHRCLYEYERDSLIAKRMSVGRAARPKEQVANARAKLGNRGCLVNNLAVTHRSHHQQMSRLPHPIVHFHAGELSA